MKPHSALVALAAAALLAASSACQAPRAGSPTPQPSPTGGATAAATATPDFTGQPLNIVTGGAGGVYIVYGGGLANLLTNELGVAATAQSTTASVDNMKFIRDRSADLAFTLSDTAFDAVNGRNRFEPPEQPVPALTLAVLYGNFTHIVTKADSGINAVADLRGKRVSVGSPGSGTEVIANRVLEAAGLTQEDLQAQKLGVADSASGLRDGRLDAFFWSGGLPTSAVVELANSPGIQLKLIGHADLVEAMAEKYGEFYFTATIPRDAYRTQEDVEVAGTANLLVVHEDFDEDLAYAILQAMFDNKAELETIHPEAKNLTLESAIEGSPIDFHPGAIRFYEDRGVWKD